MPSPRALLTPSATHFDGSPNPAIGPVSGVIMPILMVLLAARDDWNAHGDATAVAPPAAASLRILRRCWSTLPSCFFSPHLIFIVPSLVQGGRLVWAAIGTGPAEVPSSQTVYW